MRWGGDLGEESGVLLGRMLQQVQRCYGHGCGGQVSSVEEHGCYDGASTICHHGTRV